MNNDSRIFGGGNEDREWINHPEGQFAMRCIDYVFYRKEDRSGTMKDKIRLVFWSGKKHPDNGAPLTVIANFNRTIYPGSYLSNFLEAWRGKKFSDEERNGGFDIKNVVGAPLYAQVVYNHVGDRTYANIQSPMMIPPGVTAPGMPEDYKPTLGWPEDERPSGTYEPAPAPAPTPNLRDANDGRNGGPPSFSDEPWPTPPEEDTAPQSAGPGFSDDSDLPF